MTAPSPLRVVFLGSDAIALPLLNWLAAEGKTLAEVIAVFTQPDRATGRGQKVKANAIKEWALARGLPVHQPEKLTEEVRAQFAGLHADVALVMAYGHILKDDFIQTPRLGTLNLHASILPGFRGASPIQTAVASGEKETGVSLMRIVRRLDAGPVADVERIPIGPRDTALEIESRMAAACVPLLARSLPKLATGQLKFVEQNESAATFCRRLVKEDGVLDFNAPASQLAARVNGLFPWPGCVVALSGETIRLGSADATDEAVSEKPGTILAPDPEGLRVATGQGVVRFRSLQRPGGRMLPAADFLRGFPPHRGEVIPSTPMPPLVAREPFRKQG